MFWSYILDFIFIEKVTKIHPIINQWLNQKKNCKKTRSSIRVSSAKQK